MDLHIYDMKLQPGDAVVIYGNIPADEAESFSSYLNVLKIIFKDNPIIYVPNDITFFHSKKKYIAALLKSSMAKEDLECLKEIVNNAIQLHESEEGANEV